MYFLLDYQQYSSHKWQENITSNFLWNYKITLSSWSHIKSKKLNSCFSLVLKYATKL